MEKNIVNLFAEIAFENYEKNAGETKATFDLYERYLQPDSEVYDEASESLIEAAIHCESENAFYAGFNMGVALVANAYDVVKGK